MDTLTPAERSARMGRVRGKDTRAEHTVRRLCHALGYRFRLHRRDLPGTSDLVFARRRGVVFVHGCFWHRHACHLGRLPKTRLDFWLSKLERNRERDVEATGALARLGWRVLVVWECELGDVASLRRRLTEFLDA